MLSKRAKQTAKRTKILRWSQLVVEIAFALDMICIIVLAASAGIESMYFVSPMSPYALLIWLYLWHLALAVVSNHKLKNAFKASQLNGKLKE